MPGKMARSRDQTSFGTAGTPEALRSPPMASREPRRLLPSTPFQSSSGECRSIYLCIRFASARWLLLAVVAALETILAPIRTARSDDLGLISKLGEFQKAEGLVSDYKVNEENHWLDLTIVPTTPLAAGEAVSIGRATCSLGTRQLAANLSHAWTVRAFVPGDSAPAFACEIPATPRRSRRR
jgi:hypothetical protein